MKLDVSDLLLPWKSFKPLQMQHGDMRQSADKHLLHGFGGSFAFFAAVGVRQRLLFKKVVYTVFQSICI